MQSTVTIYPSAPARPRLPRQPLPTGSKTKYCLANLRVVFPLDDYTAAVHAAGRGSAMQRLFLDEFEGQLQIHRLNTIPVSVNVISRDAKLFKPASGEPQLIALLQVEVAFSALHGMWSKDFLDHATVSLRDGRYAAETIEVSLVRQ